MMLAAPLTVQPTFSPQHSSEDQLQYRPSRDLEAFNSLLPPPIEFVEGSSTGALAVAEGKYEPINGTPKAPKPERGANASQSTPTKSPSTPAAPAPSNSKVPSLYPGDIDISWPVISSANNINLGTGLWNSGNTCFLNSVLQCLLHTPPLLRILLAHDPKSCRINTFCMVCNLRQVGIQAHTTKSSFSPTLITSKLQAIAKGMRRGRQEDSHEFLRYAIDALQKSCLAGLGPKPDPKLAETTWVHKMFGGKLRSRVTCQACHYNSDTFDNILDLSLDIHRMTTMKDALRKFVAPDFLKGADKYKCEKCKKHVNAEKRFTLHDSPVVLTVHLKRFSPLGHKIGHHVQYDDHLTLQPYMSQGQYGPEYSLYGVICHAGGGPNSGHYFAYVKSKAGRWFEMNDESVSPCSPPLGKKNAYILFYLRNKGQRLDTVVKSLTPSTPNMKPGVVGAMKKRKAMDDEAGEDQGTKVSKPFIGPVLPSPSPAKDGQTPDSKRQKLNGLDPQASLVNKKIQDARKVTASGALTSLGDYASDSDDDEPEKEGVRGKSSPRERSSPTRSPQPSSSMPPPPVPPSSASSSSPATVAPLNFYSSSNSSSGNKRKSLPNDDRFRGSPLNRSNGYNPFGGRRFAANGKPKTYGRKPRAI